MLWRKGLSESAFRAEAPNIWVMLERLARNFKPGGIIDAGAHKGYWARSAGKLFNCPVHMIEAQPELEPDLASRGFPYSITLLGSETKLSDFYLSGTGSSVMPELTSFPREATRLPMKRLDDLPIELPKPLLFKLDVQGFELEVLKGAPKTLGQSEVVPLEVSLLPYNDGAPLMHEIVAYMLERGFVPYDFSESLRRSSDDALCQADMLFVRSDSQLRAKRKFWAHE